MANSEVDDLREELRLERERTAKYAEWYKELAEIVLIDQESKRTDEEVAAIRAKVNKIIHQQASVPTSTVEATKLRLEQFKLEYDRLIQGTSHTDAVKQAAEEIGVSERTAWKYAEKFSLNNPRSDS